MRSHYCGQVDEALLDQQHDALAAVGPVRALMFIEKFTHDLNQRFDQFE